MAKHKHIDKICIVATLLTVLLTILFMNGKALGIALIESEDSSSKMFTANDCDDSWYTSNATKIVLSDEKSTVSGNGAYVSGGNIYIVYGGEYVISGNLSNGKIIIEADGDDKIWMMLDGVSIHCNDDAALRIEQAGKVFVTLKDEKENILSSGAEYAAEAVSAGVDGTVYSRDDLTINGSGSLIITSEYQHGIVCNDDLVISGGNITVNVAQDGLHGNDSIRIKDTEITVSAGDDGITVSNDEETSYLYVESGKIDISSCYEGLEAVQVTIAGGKIDILSTDDGINANGYGGNSAINISGGEITIENQAGRDTDGLDSNKDIFISGGTLFVSVSNDGSSNAIDYGNEYGGKCQISGGIVLACGSSGMSEGFDSESSQGFLMYNRSAAAGTAVTVKNSQGNTLVSATIPCSFSSVLVSTPEMKVGDICTIAVGNTEEEVTVDNSSRAATFEGGQMPDPVQAPDSSQQSEPPEMPGGGQMPGESPKSGGDGSGDIQSGTPPEMPQDGQSFDRQPDEGGMQMPGDNQAAEVMPEQEEAAQEDAGASLSTEDMLLLGISAAVMAAGYMIALVYRRRN